MPFNCSSQEVLLSTLYTVPVLLIFAFSSCGHVIMLFYVLMPVFILNDLVCQIFGCLASISLDICICILGTNIGFSGCSRQQQSQFLRYTKANSYGQNVIET